jgi:outer membrane protein OmpA-like peptidoglycan-associated protein
MTRRTLRTTTASILAISLIQPFPAMAQIRALNVNTSQQSSVITGQERLFLAQSEAPTCFTNGQVDIVRCDVEMLRAELDSLLEFGLADAEVRLPEDELTAALSAEERIGLLTAAIAEAELEAALKADEAAQAEAEAAAQAEAEATAQAEAEAAARAEAEAAAAAEEVAQAEAQAAEAAAEEAAQAEADEAARIAAEAEAAEAAQAAEAEAAAAAEAEATSQAQAEADAAQAAEAEEAARIAAEDAAQAEAETEAEAEAEASSEAEQTAQAEAEAKAKAEAEAEQAAQTAAEDAAGAEALADTEQAAADEAEASAQKDAEIIAEQEEAQSLAAVTAQSVDGNAEAEAEAEAATTTEVITTEGARSSDQEFETRAAEATRNNERGLSTLEKGGLLALGALAVGALIQNNQRVAATSGDRVIVEDNSGRFQVLKDDDALIRQPGSTVQTRRFDDGSSTSTVTRENGTRIVTIRDAYGRVLRRSFFDLDGRETLLIDDITTVEPVNVRTLPPATRMNFQGTDRDALRAALRELEQRELGRTFSLRQVREIVEVRELAPQISIDDVTFRTGSAAIDPSEAEGLREIGLLMRQMIRENPREIFLIEGYTDAVGSASSNLLLSDRRAESVALALSEYFDVPPENMVVQGFGERFLKIPTLEAERQNRRVAVRRITSLLAQR